MDKPGREGGGGGGGGREEVRGIPKSTPRNGAPEEIRKKKKKNTRQRGREMEEEKEGRVRRVV